MGRRALRLGGGGRQARRGPQVQGAAQTVDSRTYLRLDILPEKDIKGLWATERFQCCVHTVINGKGDAYEF